MESRCRTAVCRSVSPASPVEETELPPEECRDLEKSPILLVGLSWCDGDSGLSIPPKNCLTFPTRL